MIKTVIVEDHHLVREGLKALLEKERDIEVVGEAADGFEALAVVERVKPDVAVIDISLPLLNGNQAIKRINALEAPPRIVVLSMYSDPVIIRTAFRNGAKAYVLKQAAAQELMLAVKAAANNQNFMSHSISEACIENVQKYDADFEPLPATLLTPREIEVLQLVAEGHGNQAIGQLLNISVKTVEKHKSNIMGKININQTAGLVKFALRHGLTFID